MAGDPPPTYATTGDQKNLKYGEVIGGWRFRDRRWHGDQELLVFSKMFGDRKQDRAIDVQKDLVGPGRKLEEALAALDAEITAPKEPVQG